MTVVDCSGIAQALRRDRFAGLSTVPMAIKRHYTAIGLHSDTIEFFILAQSGTASSGIRAMANVVAVGGSMPPAGGAVVGTNGLSGGPTGETNETCAEAGIAATSAELDV